MIPFNFWFMVSSFTVQNASSTETLYITETIKEETLKIGLPVAMLQMVDAHLPIVPG